MIEIDKIQELERVNQALIKCLMLVMNDKTVNFGLIKKIDEIMSEFNYMLDDENGENTVN